VSRTRTVTATVALAEPLPAGDHIARVVVEDVSRADASSTVVAERTVALTGPMNAGDLIAVELPVGDVDDHASYVVRAHIDSSGSGDVSSGDRITTRSYPVLTRGAPDRVDVEVVQI
jgi:uncharacterized lipoprotein YbaY